MKKFIFLFLILRVIVGIAQTDTIAIQEVIISANRSPVLHSESGRVISVIQKEEIQNSSASSIEDLLETVLNVDVRQRGTDGVQADINIRGGSVDQTLILLNGVNISDVQSGHHNLNIPIDLSQIERIEILEGAGARLYGTNAFCGAINIITGEKQKNHLTANLEAGQNDYIKTGLAMSLASKKTIHHFNTSYKTSSGYIENTDFKILNIFYQFSLKWKHKELKFQSGITNKGFGANCFYSQKFPNQYEKINTSFVNLNYRTTGKLKFVSTIFWRRNQDRFELFRQNPASWYSGHNFHLTHSFGINSNLHFNSLLGVSSVGVELRRDNIQSNVLGEWLGKPVSVPFENNAFYTKGKDRTNGNFFVEQNYAYKNLYVSGGISINWNSLFAWNFSPGIDLSYRIRKNAKVFASLNHSIRLPTYTDLYYEGPTNLGNPHLLPEKAISIETGMKYSKTSFQSHFALFRRYGSNIIDWVKPTASSKWQAQNITQLTTSGIEIACKKNFKNGFIKANYAYIIANKDSKKFISKYALDYLKHKIVIVVQHQIYHHLYVSMQMIFQNRAGTFNAYDEGVYIEKEYKAFTVFDSKLSWKKGHIEIYTDIHNILDTEYNDIGNITMPGRWIRMGIALKL